MCVLQMCEQNVSHLAKEREHLFKKIFQVLPKSCMWGCLSVTFDNWKERLYIMHTLQCKILWVVNLCYSEGARSFRRINVLLTASSSFSLRFLFEHVDGSEFLRNYCLLLSSTTRDSPENQRLCSHRYKNIKNKDNSFLQCLFVGNGVSW
jgi:hypothetical protein